MRRLLLGLLLTGLGHVVPAQTIELRNATQHLPGGASQPLHLPALLRAEPRNGAIDAHVSAEFQVARQPAGWSVYLPGILGEGELALNGHRLTGALLAPARTPDQGREVLRVIEIPDEFWVSGRNRFDLRLRALGTVGAPQLVVGPDNELQRLRGRQVWLGYTGPLLVATVVGGLGLCVLSLFARLRGESIYGYFGLGALCWGMQSVWSVQLSPLFEQPHESVWWNSLYMFWVAMLTIFGLHFTRFRRPFIERGIWTLALAGPIVLYTAYAIEPDALRLVAAYWRLMWIGIIILALGAVAHQVLRQHSVEGALILVSAFFSVTFGLHDWLAAQRGQELAPVELTAYAGLPFVMLAAWILIDRFLSTTHALEALNRELESRVEAKSEQLTRAFDQMRDARNAAEAANRAKSSFLAAASHDLRQPVHALGLYMAALGGESLPPEQREVITRMNSSVAALDSMFNGLLDVSRMDAGAVEPQRQGLRLDILLHRLAEDCAPLAGDKGLRLAVRVAPAADRLNALSDPMLLDRLIRNLLSNAVKYTHKGGVLLACRLRQANRAAPVWHIEIWDTGIGIPRQEQARIFDEFYQIGNAERDRSAGLGLGLAIVARIAALLGHRLELRSTVGRGTRFLLEVPATTQPIPAPPAPIGNYSLAGMPVAVFEDDVEVRHSMRALLTHWGCIVTDAADLREFLDCTTAADLQALQAVVADLRLRHGDTGLDVLRAINARRTLPVPALIVSGDSSPAGVALIAGSGLEWLPKPVAASRLQLWLTAVALRASGGSGLASEQAGEPAGAATPQC